MAEPEIEFPRAFVGDPSALQGQSVRFDAGAGQVQVFEDPLAVSRPLIEPSQAGNPQWQFISLLDAGSASKLSRALVTSALILGGAVVVASFSGAIATWLSQLGWYYPSLAAVVGVYVFLQTRRE